MNFIFSVVFVAFSIIGLNEVAPHALLAVADRPAPTPGTRPKNTASTSNAIAAECAQDNARRAAKCRQAQQYQQAINRLIERDNKLSTSQPRELFRLPPRQDLPEAARRHTAGTCDVANAGASATTTATCGRNATRLEINPRKAATDPSQINEYCEVDANGLLTGKVDPAVLTQPYTYVAMQQRGADASFKEKSFCMDANRLAQYGAKCGQCRNGVVLWVGELAPGLEACGRTDARAISPVCREHTVDLANGKAKNLAGKTLTQEQMKQLGFSDDDVKKAADATYRPQAASTEPAQTAEQTALARRMTGLVDRRGGTLTEEDGVRFARYGATIRTHQHETDTAARDYVVPPQTSTFPRLTELAANDAPFNDSSHFAGQTLAQGSRTFAYITGSFKYGVHMQTGTITQYPLSTQTILIQTCNNPRGCL